MQINEFARMAYERSQKNSKTKHDWEFYIIGLGGEAGELLNILKKIKRGDFPMDKDKIADETADILTYAFILLSSIGVDPEKAIMKKYEEVNKRIALGGFDKRVS